MPSACSTSFFRTLSSFTWACRTLASQILKRLWMRWNVLRKRKALEWTFLIRSWWQRENIKVPWSSTGWRSRNFCNNNSNNSSYSSSIQTNKIKSKLWIISNLNFPLSQWPLGVLKLGHRAYCMRSKSPHNPKLWSHTTYLPISRINLNPLLHSFNAIWSSIKILKEEKTLLSQMTPQSLLVMTLRHCQTRKSCNYSIFWIYSGMTP